MGTLVAVPMYYGLAQFSEGTYLLIMLLVIVSGVWICGKASEDIGVHDHGGIVWDEIAGYLLTMYWVTFSWQKHGAGLCFIQAIRYFETMAN
jgi:phosphatidylglycerophosphatase (EC 3.1.3.27)